MYNNGNSSKNVTGASVVDGTMESADYADNGLSGDKIDGGIISNFQSTGIDDRLPTGKVLTLSDNNAAIDGKADVVLEDAVTNASSDVLKLTHTTSGTTGTGMGAAMVFRTENSTYSNINDVARIYTRELSETELKNDLIFETKSNNVMTEKARILWSGGITFNGDTAAANALDDYEEGTWTPEFRGSTGSAGTSSTTITNAVYTKVGNIVTASCDIRWALIGSWTGSVLLYGLPFPAGAKFVASTAILKNVENPDTLPFVGVVYPAASNFKFFRQISDLGMKYQAPVTYFDNVLNEFNISITYTV